MDQPLGTRILNVNFLTSSLPTYFFIFGHLGELSDPNCEERESNDDCCVLVVCSAKEGEEETGEINNNEGDRQEDNFNIEREGNDLRCSL